MTRSRHFVSKCCAIFLAVFLGLWALSLLSLYVQDRQDDTEFTWRSLFFMDTEISFTDLTDFDPQTARFAYSSGSYGLSYPAPMMCGLLLFNRLFPHPIRSYEFFVIAVTLAGLVVLLRSLNRKVPIVYAAAVLGVLGSYPLMHLMERANIEGLLFAVEALGIIAFVVRRHLAAGLLIALACSMKLYPGLLLLLLFSRKRYREFSVACVAVLVFSVIGFWIMGPTVPKAAADVFAGMAKERENYFTAFRENEIGFDHSVLAFVKTGLFISGFNAAGIKRVISALFMPYFFVCVGGLVTLYFLRIRRLPTLNQIVLYVSLCVSLPFMSQEYTLVHIHIAWALFLVFLARDVASGTQSLSFRAAMAFLLPCAVIFAPGTYITWPTNPHGAVVKTVSLICLCVAALMVPLRCSLLENTSSGSQLR